MSVDSFIVWRRYLGELEACYDLQEVGHHKLTEVSDPETLSR